MERTGKDVSFCCNCAAIGPNDFKENGYSKICVRGNLNRKWTQTVLRFWLSATPWKTADAPPPNGENDNERKTFLIAP